MGSHFTVIARKTIGKLNIKMYVIYKNALKSKEVTQAGAET